MDRDVLRPTLVVDPTNCFDSIWPLPLLFRSDFVLSGNFFEAVANHRSSHVGWGYEYRLAVS